MIRATRRRQGIPVKKKRSRTQEELANSYDFKSAIENLVESLTGEQSSKLAWLLRNKDNPLATDGERAGWDIGDTLQRLLELKAYREQIP